MTKSELEQIFDQFAKTAIKEDDDGWYLFGMNASVSWVDNTWDVNICNQAAYSLGRYTARLGTGKINNICATLPESITVTRLDGESYFQTTDLEWLKSWLFENRLALRIKKRVSFNPNSSNLAKNNAGTAPA